MIESIIFDFDGVIANSLDDVIYRWNIESKIFGKGIKITKSFVRRRDTGSWKVFYQKHLGVPKNKLDASSKMFFSLAKQQGPSKLFPNIAVIIQQLYRKYDLYIVSSNHSETIKAGLKHHKLTKYFTGIAGAKETFGLNKTDKKFLQTPLKKWNVNLKTAIYLGDTRDEVYGAKSAGIKSMACTWGYQDAKLLKLAQPDLIAKLPLQIPKLIERLF